VVFEAANPTQIAGAPPGFESVYRLYCGWVLGYFLRRGFRREVAVEFTQDVFLRVYVHEMHEEPKERFVPWLITVAKNKAVSEYRRKESQVAHVELEDGATAGSSSPRDPEAVCSEAEAAEALRARIREMPEMMRKCITLRYYHDLRPEEAAAYLGLSENTVKTHLKRGLAFLRLDFGEERGREGERA
jgi:RNA polymerase sigma-70 factor, ECF subfamily